MVHRPRRAALGMRDADEEADATPPAGRGGRRRSLVQQLSGSPMSWGRSTKGERGRGGGTSSEGGESPVSPPSAFGTEDEEAVVACATPTPMGGKRYGERAGDPADPDVVFYGDELRLWAVSEYAVAKQATATRGGEAARKAEGDLGGYVGVYFKGRKRRARTGAGKGRDAPDFKGSELGRCPLALADFWTSDHRSERSRSVDAFPERARATHSR